MRHTISMHKRIQVYCDASGRVPRPQSRTQRLRQHGIPKLTPEQRREEQRRLQHEIDNSINDADETPPPQSPDMSATETSPLPSTPDTSSVPTSTTPPTDTEIAEDDDEPISTKEEYIHREIQRKSQILVEIFRAGASVESTISQYSHEIDEVMLQILEKRIETAQKLEQKPETVHGLSLLLQRLNAEFDRQRASPALRLLDSLLAIMANHNNNNTNNSGDVDSGQMVPDINTAMGKSPATTDGDIRRQLLVKLKASFGNAPLKTDVFSLASQLASSGGGAIVDEMMEDLVNADQFIDEVKGLLENAVEQQRQLVDALKNLPEENLSDRERVQNVIDDREEALKQVQLILSLAISVTMDIKL